MVFLTKIEAKMWKKAVLNENRSKDVEKSCFERKQKQRCGKKLF